MPEKVNYNPDILSCLANLSSDEVFTPPEIANAMLDMLPQELFRSPDTKFLDPGCKSGVFLREIAKRLNEGLKDKIPDVEKRMDHIMKNQLFAIAITQITGLLSRRSVYCSKDASGRFSVARFDNSDGNIRYRRVEHKWVDGRCSVCGASQDVQDRGAELETHAYEFIHMDDIELKELKDMKFDVIIANPPYQLADGGNNASAIPLYHRFVEQAKKLNPRYLSMIIPARWYAGGRGLDEFRDSMRTDHHISIIRDFANSSECFPGVDISGGICYFLWEREHDGPCRFVNMERPNEYVDRYLEAFPIVVRDNKAISILEKVTSRREEMYSSRVSSYRPFGLRTYGRPEESGDLMLRWNGGKGPYPRAKITIGTELIDKWKVIVSRVFYEHGGQSDNDGKYRVLSVVEELPPGEICTETYLVVDSFDSKKECNNLYEYLKTKFARFLVLVVSSSIMVSKSSYRFVPMQDFSKPWTDEELYQKYGLTEDEIAFIESMIKPMDGGADA